MTATILENLRDSSVGVSSEGASLSLRGITKVFGRQVVLRGIDLDIAPGQFVAIVGRSGCGKSTLLRLLAGLDQPTSGQISIDGVAGGWGGQGRLVVPGPRVLPRRRGGGDGGSG